MDALVQIVHVPLVKMLVLWIMHGFLQILFSNVVSCNVSDFDPTCILSDVHSAVTFCLCTEALIGVEIDEPHNEL